jgi:CHAT domain-containing protein
MRNRVLQICAAALLLSLALPLYANRFQDFQRLKGEGKTAEALEVLRKEIAKPSFFLSGGAQPVYIRQHFLLTLGEYAGRVGVTSEFDTEAHGVYEQGVEKYARNNSELRAILDNGIALYFSNSYRNGLALPYMRKELEYWESAGNPMRMTLGYDAIASAYWDMGEFELSRYYMEKALESAAGYFVLGKRPSDINEWSEYWNILGKHMDNAGQVGDVELLERLWKLQEPIEPQYWGNGALTGFTAAQHFALASQVERGREMLAKASELWLAFPGRSSNARLKMLGDAAEICTRGIVSVAAKAYTAATTDLEECLESNTEVGLKEHDASFKQKLGLSYEGSGKPEEAIAAYREAIAATEVSRASYSVAERAKFFRTFFRKSYWGLVRVQAKRARQDQAAFFEALHTSELVRGRQLGELIDPQTAERITPASLKTLQTQLPADAVVLAYTATDTELVVLAMARDRLLASVTPYDRKAFATLVRGIAAGLARPTSNLQALNGRLLKMSNQVLAEVRPLLAGRKRITALPDGIMNMVPFELLSAAEDAYKPLIADYVVSVSPSLLFIEYAERQRRTGRASNLVALADPNYSKPDTLAAATWEEIEVATRGSRYLSYFEPLPETRSEAAAIAKMFAGEKVDLLVGGDALESRLKTTDLEGYGFLHFATHGILGGEVPGIGEPALVLGDEPGEDGFLTSTEVGALKINAELTVLSACNTGSGEFVTGEGVMGMSRAFLAAGSLSVVVSLWPVASQQTERLMVEFYRLQRAGKPAAEALREAKLKMIAQAQKTGSAESHPFFWAPFILLGG